MSAVPEVWRQPFPEDEIPIILAAILRCMGSVKKKITHEHENPITFRLANKLSSDAVLRTRPIRPDWEAWQLGDENDAQKAARLDIRFLYSTGAQHPWPCFVIEAKRLHVTYPGGSWSSLVPEYVTSHTNKPVAEEQGMMCFISGRYSRGLRSGAMLGYVFDGNVDGARASLEKTIQQHANKLKLSSPGWLGDSSVMPGTGISESRHNLANDVDLTDRESFTIFHILVPV